MNIVIIEDELLTAEDLKDVIATVLPQAEIVTTLQSVKEAVAYFKANPMPQLIFSDIQLGDGLSFDIFSEVEVKVPIIFCTAFDEYAMKAFNASGIHYVLKPFNHAKIKAAVDKYFALQNNFSAYSKSIEDVIEELKSTSLQQQPKKAEAVLVHFQNRIIPIKLEDIALFYVKNEATHLFTFDQKTYVINKTLDELQQLDAELFYRANRQYILNRHVVKEASHYQARKVSIELNLPFHEVITISKEKITPFFDWLANGR